MQPCIHKLERGNKNSTMVVGKAFHICAKGNYSPTLWKMIQELKDADRGQWFPKHTVLGITKRITKLCAVLNENIYCIINEL